MLGCLPDRGFRILVFLRLQGLAQTGIGALPVPPLIRYVRAFSYEYFTPPPSKDLIEPFRVLIHASTQRSAFFVLKTTLVEMNYSTMLSTDGAGHVSHYCIGSSPLFSRIGAASAE